MLYFALPTLMTLLALQSQSGRSFHRVSRLPVTEPATQVVEASTLRQERLPLVRMRSGRAWSRFHHSRLPQAGALRPEVDVVDASTPQRFERRGYWGQRH